jgi:thiamine-monophosphate kinase
MGKIMPLNEFDIIKKYFTRSAIQPSVNKSVGDDCAIVSVESNKQLVLSMDSLVSGRHFPEDAKAYDIGTRALCTSVSDLAAMGATPLWFTLGLTLPSVDECWLQNFSEGLFAIANKFNMDLIGGDTTKGPLTVTVQVHGEVSKGQALTRAGAQAGDVVFVTGSLGDGAAALALIQNKLIVDSSVQQYLTHRFYAPEPQVISGQYLVGVANAAIDISDGLLADAGHIAIASGVDIALNIEALPISAELQAVDQECIRSWALSGGDDYQLLFTVNAEQLMAVQDLIDRGVLQATPIGNVTEGDGQVGCYWHGKPYQLFNQSSGYQHFAS